MSNRWRLKLRIKRRWFHLWRTSLMMIACAILYYSPYIVASWGWADTQAVLDRLHNLYGIDLYALFFFIPVVYMARAKGVIGASMTALVTMLILFPYAIFTTPYPETLFKPAAFVIILSAVGSVVAMLQRSDEQRQRNLSQLTCLYEVGKAVYESRSVEEFVRSVTEIIPNNIRFGGDIKVRILVREQEFKTPGFENSPDTLKEDLTAGDEVLGSIEIYSTDGSSFLEKNGGLLKTLAGRVGGAIREIELQLSLEEHFTLMEDMVEERTRDLESAQEKLIRSERLAAVGELASGVGHELRNPLNVIKNCAYLLNMNMDGKADDETVNTLKLLDRQVDIANRIITDLLDFTRVSPPSLNKVDLNTLVKESASWVTVPKNSSVKTGLDSSSPKVYVDAEQVGRAFANVISNAFQAMNGGGELIINTGVNGSHAWASFQDTGCGIPEEHLGRIFEPLFTTKPKGIGLGLAITKRLIEQNHGVIEVKSQVAKGTTFTLKLPLYNNKEAGNNERASQRAGCR